MILEILKKRKEGNHRAGLALDIFAYGVRKYIGAYAAQWAVLMRWYLLQALVRTRAV